MATYGQPRRLNAVTFVMILMGLAAGYWVWRFFPVYFDGWNVDHLLKEAASKTYRLNRMQEPERSKELKTLVDKTLAEIRKQGNVTDPELSVSLDVDPEGKNAAVTADYHVEITHPGITQTTILHFHKTESADIKKVKWE
jgi:hypothetical protein